MKNFEKIKLIMKKRLTSFILDLISADLLSEIYSLV